jgi:general secretion pathway protein D
MRFFQPALPCLLAAILSGCATSAAFRAGSHAERREDYDQAILQYSKALQEQPDNLTFRKSLERAKLRGSEEHAASAERLIARGLYKEALDELRLALDLQPDSPRLALRITEVTGIRNEGLRPSHMEDIKLAARENPLAGLVPGPGVNEPLGLSFRSASLREAYQALGRAADVNFIFAPEFRDRTIDLDLSGVPFDQALMALSSTGQTFHRVLDTQLVRVIPDTPTLRKQHEQQFVKTFFLSNADLKDTVDLLRIVLGARRVAPLPGVNALSINDSPEKIAAAERIIAMIDKRRAEVLVEVEILEINRTLLKEYGIEITSGIDGLQGIAGGVFPKDTTLDQNPYEESNIVVSSLPGVVYRLLRTDSSARLLANPQLRTSEGETAQARFGDQVPVPVTTFAPIAQGGVQQQPITSFEYKNVGVNIDVTPRAHHDGDVTLELALDVSQVGPIFQGLPTFNSREVNSTIRLRDGETAVLAGLISDIQREVIRGMPGLSLLPFIGRLFSYNLDEVQQTDVIITLTPRVLERPRIDIDDLRSFALGGEASPLLFEVPVAPTPTTQRPAPARNLGPIRPPEPEPSPDPDPQAPR